MHDAIRITVYEYTIMSTPLGYERVYVPLYKVADTPFHIQGADFYLYSLLHRPTYFTIHVLLEQKAGLPANRTLHFESKKTFSILMSLCKMKRCCQQVRYGTLPNPLSPHDASMHYFTSLKTDLISLQLRVLERTFR